jgi:hypothetical protein
MAFNSFEYQFTTGKPLKNTKLTIKYYADLVMTSFCLSVFGGCATSHIFLIGVQDFMHIYLQMCVHVCMYVALAHERSMYVFVYVCITTSAL